MTNTQKIMEILGLTGLAVVGYAGDAQAEKPSSPQAHGIIEASANEDTTSIDTKVGAPVGKGFGLFTRNRIGTDYDGKTTGTMNLGKVSYALGGGASAEVGAAGNAALGMTPRAGLSYRTKLGDLKVMQMALASKGDKANALLVTGLDYRTGLAEDIDLALRAENTMIVGKKGLAKGFQFLRGGVAYKGLETGLTVDCTETANKLDGCKVGGYAAVKF